MRSVRAIAAGVALAVTACGDTRIVLEEIFPAGTEFKVVAWDDGLDTQAVLRDATDRSEFPLTEALADGRDLQVWIYPFSRAQLVSAVPGLVGASVPEIMAGVSAVVKGGTRIPGDDVVLQARFNSDGDLAESYQSTSRAALDASPDHPSFGIAVANDLACRAVPRPDVFELPAAFTPLGLAAVDADRLLIAGTTGTVAYALLDVSAAGVKRVPVDVPGLRGPSVQMGWEATSGTIWGRDTGSRIYRISDAGGAVPFPDAPTAQVNKLSVGRDGTVLTIGLRNADGDLPTHTYDPQRDRWDTIVDLFETRADEIRTYGRGRHMGHLNCWTRIWEFDPNQGFEHWGKERAGESSCTLFPRDIAVDGSRYYFLSSGGNLQVGDDTDAPWGQITHGINVTTDDRWPQVVAPMEDTRFAVAGDRGQIEVWIGDRWCIPAVQTPTIDLKLAAGIRGAAWFVGSDQMGTVRALRVLVQTGE